MMNIYEMLQKEIVLIIIRYEGMNIIILDCEVKLRLGKKVRLYYTMGRDIM